MFRRCSLEAEGLIIGIQKIFKLVFHAASNMREALVGEDLHPSEAALSPMIREFRIFLRKLMGTRRCRLDSDQESGHSSTCFPEGSQLQSCLQWSSLPGQPTSSLKRSGPGRELEVKGLVVLETAGRSFVFTLMVLPRRLFLRLRYP